MKCLQCGSAMQSKKENVRYDSSGLPITLVGVRVDRCPDCGDYEVAIPQIESLHRAIALTLVRQASRLRPAEIRFLRTYLDWSGNELAKRMGVAPETVSRWEQGTTAMGVIADRLLRSMVLFHLQVSEPLDVLRHAGVKKAAASVPVRYKTRKNGWVAEAA